MERDRGIQLCLAAAAGDGWGGAPASHGGGDQGQGRPGLWAGASGCAQICALEWATKALGRWQHGGARLNVDGERRTPADRETAEGHGGSPGLEGTRPGRDGGWVLEGGWRLG